MKTRKNLFVSEEIYGRFVELADKGGFRIARGRNSQMQDTITLALDIAHAWLDHDAAHQRALRREIGKRTHTRPTQEVRR